MRVPVPLWLLAVAVFGCSMHSRPAETPPGATRPVRTTSDIDPTVRACDDFFEFAIW